MLRFNAFDGECYLWLFLSQWHFPWMRKKKLEKHLLCETKIIHDFSREKSFRSCASFELIAGFSEIKFRVFWHAHKIVMCSLLRLSVKFVGNLLFTEILHHIYHLSTRQSRHYFNKSVNVSNMNWGRKLQRREYIKRSLNS